MQTRRSQRSGDGAFVFATNRALFQQQYLGQKRSAAANGTIQDQHRPGHKHIKEAVVGRTPTQNRNPHPQKRPTQYPQRPKQRPAFASYRREHRSVGRFGLKYRLAQVIGRRRTRPGRLQKHQRDEPHAKPTQFRHRVGIIESQLGFADGEITQDRIIQQYPRQRPQNKRHQQRTGIPPNHHQRQIADLGNRPNTNGDVGAVQLHRRMRLRMKSRFADKIVRTNSLNDHV